MHNRLRQLVLTATLAVLCVAAGASVSARTAAAGSAGNCTTASAVQAVRRYHLELEPGSPYPVGQVLCGSFLGPGSEAMVAELTVPGCGRTGGFVALRFDSGGWQKVFVSHEGAEIAAVGSDIKETQEVLRPSDSHCFPTGGTRSRIQHWDGTTFIASAWRYSKPQGKTTPPASTVKQTSFASPSRNLTCWMRDDTSARAVVCQSKDKPHSATLTPGGRLQICKGATCLRPTAGIARVLAYGSQLSVGRFRCVSTEAGFACSIPGTSKGFVIDRDGVVPVGKTAAPDSTEFYAALPGVVACGIYASGASGGVVCMALNPHDNPNAGVEAKLSPTGRVWSCKGGPSPGCPLGNPGEATPTYPVGKTVTVGPFRCQVLATGVQCTVAATGKGFLFNQDGTTPVG